MDGALWSASGASLQRVLVGFSLALLAGLGKPCDIRRALLEADLVDCMVALPRQLFSNTQIPVCLWFLAKNKNADAKRGFRDFPAVSGDCLAVNGGCGTVNGTRHLTLALSPIEAERESAAAGD